jgi:uncharacterized phage-associated protein
MSAIDVAATFLQFAKNDEDPITQMQLHKLLYFAQGLSLGIRGKLLFTDQIEAWQHGPVVPTVRGLCGSGPTVLPESFSKFGVDDPTELRFIKAVWIRFRDFSPSALRSMSHDDGPWRSVYKPGRNVVITENAMREHFTMPRNSGFDGMAILSAEVDFAEGRYSDLATVKARVLSGQSHR